MVFLRITYLTNDGLYQEFIFGNLELETALDHVNMFINSGCKLLSIHYKDIPFQSFSLPIEAFDGQPIKAPLLSLQQEWEELLIQQ